jgi:hypothetical protein
MKVLQKNDKGAAGGSDMVARTVGGFGMTPIATRLAEAVCGRLRRAGTVIALAVLIESAVPAATRAQCIMFGSPEVAFAESRAVFTGTVLRTEPTGARGEHQIVNIATFRVERTWKGDPGREARVGADRQFEVGQRYVVFATGEPLTTSLLCRWAEPVDQAGAKLDWLATPVSARDEPGADEFARRESRNRRLIAFAEKVNVRELDPALSQRSFVQWLDDIVGTTAQRRWEINDCGEQTGGGESVDVPLCAEVEVTLPEKRTLSISIVVGTSRKGPTGGAEFWWAIVTETDRSQVWLKKLSEVPAAIAHAPKVPPSRRIEQR